MSEEAPKIFTLDQANALLKFVIPWLAESRQKAAHLSQMSEKHPPGKGGTLVKIPYYLAIREFRGSLEPFRKEGILLRDLHTGLLDFPGSTSGRKIFFCWREGEERVRYWHEVEGGFQGRRPVEELSLD